MKFPLMVSFHTIPKYKIFPLMKSRKENFSLLCVFFVSDIKIKLTTSYGCRSISIDQPNDETSANIPIQVTYEFESQMDPFEGLVDSTPQPPMKRQKGFYTPQIVLQMGTFDMLVRLSPAINRYVRMLKHMSEKFNKYRDEIVIVLSNICKKNRAIPKMKSVLLPFMESLTDQIIEEVWENQKNHVISTQDETADICLEILNYCTDEIITSVVEMI